MQTKRIARRTLAIVLSLLMIIPSMLTHAATNTANIVYDYTVHQETAGGTTFEVDLYAKADTAVNLNALSFGITWDTANFTYTGISYNTELTTEGSIGIIDSYDTGAGKLGATVYPNYNTGKFYFTVPADETGFKVATITFTLKAGADYNPLSVAGTALTAIAAANKAVEHDNQNSTGLEIDPIVIDTTSFTWVKNDAAVTFYAADNSTVFSTVADKKYGDTVAAPATNPEKASDDNNSYTFVGWATSTTATAADVIDFATYTLDTLDAKFYPVYTATERTYTIKYHIGDTVNKIEAKNNEAITAPTDPSKDHYTFEGWYKADDTEFTFPSTMTPAYDNTEVWAKFTPVEYTITLVPGTDGTLTEAEKTYKYTVETENVTLPTPTANAGKTFEGWYNGDDEFVYTKGTTTGNITLTAEYTINLYDVVFNHGDTENVFNSIAHGASVTAPVYTGTTANGYRFKTWKSGSVTVNAGDPYTVTGAVTFTPEFEKITYTITITIPEGVTYDGSKSIEYQIGDEVTLGTAVKTGYNFGGWFYKVGEADTAFTYVKGTTYGDYTIYPMFTAKKYTVTVTGDTDKVSYVADPAITSPVDCDTVVSITFTKVAEADVKDFTVTVNGFGATPDATGKITFTVKGHTEVKVTATLNNYTVKFMDGETEYEALRIENAVKGTKVNEPTEPTKDHYTFDGWYTEATFENKVTFPTTVETSNLTYYAKFTANQYTIKYSIVGGELQTITDEFGKPVTDPGTERTGYTFDGWYTAADYSGAKVAFPTTMPDTNPTYYGKYVIKTYKVTVNATNATASAVIKDTVTAVDLNAVPYNTTITVTVAPAEKYEVKSITIGGVEQSKPSFDITVTDNVTVDVVTAKKQATIEYAGGTGYTVAVKNAGVDVPTGTKVDVGTELTVEVTLDAAYSNSTVVIKVNGNEITDGKFNVPDVATATITVEGVTKNTYTVKFFEENGTTEIGTSQIIEHGASAVIPTAATVPGKTFAGWKVRGGSDTVLTTIPAVTANVEYIAVYTTDEYTVTVTGDHVTHSGVKASYAYNELAEITLTADAHYTITKVTVDGVETTVTDGKISFNVKKNTTVAVTTADSEYKITYVVDGISTDIKGTYDSDVTAPTPTKDHYEFAGWYTSDTFAEDTKVEFPTKMPDTNPTLYAKFTAKQYTITLDPGTDGTLTEAEKTYKYTVLTENVALPIPTANAGKTFDGWYNGETKFVYTKGTTTGDFTLTAKYTTNEHTVTVNASNATVTMTNKATGGEVTSGSKVPYGTVLSVTVAPADKYEVTSIKIGETKYTSPFEITVQSDITIDVTTAKKQAAVVFGGGDGYTVAVKNGDAPVTSGDKFDVGTELTVTVTVEEAYNNSTVVIKVNGVVVSNGGTFNVPDAETATITVEGVTKNKYTIKFVSEGDELSAAQYEHNTPVTKPEDPTKEGYTFKGWNDGTSTVTEIPVATKAVTYTAVFEINKYTITFKAIKNADGTDAANVEIPDVEYNTALKDVSGVPTPVNYTEDGKTYKFNGWTPTFVGEAKVTSDLEFNAVYVLASSNVSINFTTIRAESVAETTYTVPDGLAVRMDAKATLKNGETDVTSSITVTETGTTVTVSGDLEAGTYTLTVKKQRYLVSVLNFTVDTYGNVTSGGSAIPTIALVPGDIVGNGTVDGDGVIDITDFIVGIRGFDPAGSVTAQAADINEDGKVTIDDLSKIKDNYGKHA